MKALLCIIDNAERLTAKTTRRGLHLKITSKGRFAESMQPDDWLAVTLNDVDVKALRDELDRYLRDRK
jgi:hypothetical protein